MSRGGAIRRIRAAGALWLACAWSCGGDDARTDTSDTGDSTVNASSPGDATTTRTTGDPSGADDDGTTSTTSSPGSSASASATSPPTSGSPTEPCPTLNADETGSNALTGDMGYAFSRTSYCDYDQIGRVAIPLVAALLITSRDEYQSSTPADDYALKFDAEINASIIGLHGALDDALEGGAWMPCSFVTCKQQLTDLIIPDILPLDPGAPEGFRNGRRPDDPAADRFLARVLLDLGLHAADAFADLPLNPPANDASFDEAWPYLAEPH